MRRCSTLCSVNRCFFAAPSRLEEAMALAREAEKLLPSAATPLRRVRFLERRGVTAGLSGDLAAAVRDFEDMRTLCRSLGNEEEARKRFANFAEFEHFRGNTNRAIEIAQETVAVLRRAGDKERVGQYLRQLGGIFRCLRQDRRRDAPRPRKRFARASIPIAYSSLSPSSIRPWLSRSKAISRERRDSPGSQKRRSQRERFIARLPSRERTSGWSVCSQKCRRRSGQPHTPRALPSHPKRRSTRRCRSSPPRSGRRSPRLDSEV